MATRMWIGSCFALGLAGLGLGAYLAYDLQTNREALIQQVRAATVQEAATAASELGVELRQASSVLDALASDLSEHHLDRSALGARLEAILEADTELLGVGVAWAPNSIAKLSAPYRTRRGDSLQGIQLEDRIDYTKPGVRWYGDALRDGAGWREPTWDEIEESMTAVYSAPFRIPGAEEPFAGVALVVVSIDRVRDRVDELDTGRTGWGVIISREGIFIVHPDEQWVESRINAMEFVEDENILTMLRRTIEKGQRSFAEAIDRNTGRSAWYFTEPVPETGWSLALIRLEDEIVTTGRSHRRRMIQTSVIVIFGLILLGVPITAVGYARTGREAALWAMAAWTSLLMMVGMEVVRSVTYDQVSDEDRETARIFDESGLKAFVASQRALWRKRQEVPPTVVPTGVLVRSLSFKSPKEVFVTGVLWQKFHDIRHVDVPRGVDLPDAMNADLTEVYRRRRGDEETVGWRFTATLRQIMDVSRYPLDHDNISIRMLPLGFDSRVILVPDLISYTRLTPSTLPGLEDALELSGWHITGSFFDYKYASYNTDLGIPDYEGEESLPELHYNVELKRELLDASIANGIPLLVVLILLFAILVTRTKDTDKSKLFGFNPSGVVRICSALFFVALLAHIQLRNTLQTQEIVFIEYAYFAAYLALMFTALHTFLFFKGGMESQLVEYREGLIAKLLYWPLLLSFLFVAMVLRFY